MVRDLQRNHPTAARDVMRTTRVQSKVERSRACAPLTKTQVWDSGFFAHALFVPKTPNAMGFSGSVNGTTKNPGFFYFGFCQCKWAYSLKFSIYTTFYRYFKPTMSIPSQTVAGMDPGFSFGEGVQRLCMCKHITRLCETHDSRPGLV